MLYSYVSGCPRQNVADCLSAVAQQYIVNTAMWRIIANLLALEPVMPIYEYQCPECANIFEEWAKASAMQEVMPCPLCQTPSERIISHTAFVLKGGGWYVTDYGYRKNISEDSSAAASAGSAAAVPPAHEASDTNTAAPEKKAAPATPAPATPASDSSGAASPSSTVKAVS